MHIAAASVEQVCSPETCEVNLPLLTTHACCHVETTQNQNHHLEAVIQLSPLLKARLRYLCRTGLLFIPITAVELPLFTTHISYYGWTEASCSPCVEAVINVPLLKAHCSYLCWAGLLPLQTRCDQQAFAVTHHCCNPSLL